MLAVLTISVTSYDVLISTKHKVQQRLIGMSLVLQVQVLNQINKLKCAERKNKRIIKLCKVQTKLLFHCIYLDIFAFAIAKAEHVSYLSHQYASQHS